MTKKACIIFAAVMVTFALSAAYAQEGEGSAQDGARQAAWEERHAEKKPQAKRVETSPPLELPDMVPPPGQTEGTEPDSKRQAVMDGEADAVTATQDRDAAELQRLYAVSKDSSATPEERKAAIEHADQIVKGYRGAEAEAEDRIPGAEGAVRYAEKVVGEKEHAAHMAELRYEEAQSYYQDDLAIGGAAMTAAEERRRREELARLEREANAANDELAAAQKNLVSRKDYRDQLEMKAAATGVVPEPAKTEPPRGEISEEDMEEAFSLLAGSDDMDQAVPRKKPDTVDAKAWDDMTKKEKSEALVHGEPGAWQGHLDGIIKAQKKGLAAEPAMPKVDGSVSGAESAGAMDGYVSQQAQKSAEKAESAMSLGSARQEMDEASTAGDQAVAKADATVSAAGADGAQTKAATAQAIAQADQAQSWGAAAADTVEAIATTAAGSVGGALGAGAAQAVSTQIYPPSSTPSSATGGGGATAGAASTPATSAGATAGKATGGSYGSGKSATTPGKEAQSEAQAGGAPQSPPAQGAGSGGGWTCPFCGSTAGYYLSRDHQSEQKSKVESAPEGTLVQGSLTALVGQRDYSCKSCRRVVRRTYEGGRVQNADANGNFK